MYFVTAHRGIFCQWVHLHLEAKVDFRSQSLFSRAQFFHLLLFFFGFLFLREIRQYHEGKYNKRRLAERLDGK
jgi:hypothetical protein